MARRILVRALLSLISIVGLGGLLVLIASGWGLVMGEEFAPDTFERRTYWYYEIPLIRVKITPISRTVEQNQLESMLVASKYVAAKSPPKRWDLVTAQRSGQVWRKGDAQILCQYLDAWDSEPNLTSYWETWTTDHPALAKVLWPEIASLARRELYFLIPPLFEKALEHDKPQSLQNNLDQVLAHSFDLLADTESELGNLETAVQFYSDALSHQAGRASSLQGRAACYEKLGKSKEAAQDRQAIAQQAEREP